MSDTEKQLDKAEDQVKDAVNANAVVSCSLVNLKMTQRI